MNTNPFSELPKGSELMAAFSGGVDSSVAAYLCKKAGYKIRAVTMCHLGHDPVLCEKALAAAAAASADEKEAEV